MVLGDDNRAERDDADIAALERLRSGDATAVGDLYDRYAKTALGLALKIVRDAEEAEDIVHDAFMAVVERAHQYQAERGTVAAWLLTTVRNLSLDRTRRRTRRAQIADNDLRPEVEALGIAVDDPETRLTLERERKAVRDAMNILPKAQRDTLIIAFFEGLSYPEMAERDGVPLGTIKSRAARAIHALRSCLTDRGWGGGAQRSESSTPTDQANEPRASSAEMEKKSLA